MSKVLSDTLGELIKKAMVERGLNQSAIARKMDVAKQTINQIEKKKIFDLDFLVRFREASGLDFTSHALPKDKKPYVPAAGYSVVGEPSEDYADINALSMSVSIKIESTDEGLIGLADFIKTIKREAQNRGFKIL